MLFRRKIYNALASSVGRQKMFRGGSNHVFASKSSLIVVLLGLSQCGKDSRLAIATPSQMARPAMAGMISMWMV
jgi:hypothetical protein